MKPGLPCSPNSKPLLLLAPMEGVVDWATRDLFSELGGLDLVVTEFIRVVDRQVPDEVFFRYAPELKTNSKTNSGTPLLVQLLGSDANALADSAARAAELGAYGIDLNFGCPAKTVNRHDGGAALLKTPERIENILRQVRQSLPQDVSLSAKIRLGFDVPEICLVNAQAAASGGASWLTVHCRTKMDMYKPPAYWDWIPKMRELIDIPIVANGEVWTLEDYWRCRQISGSEHVMIGRGALADPFLFLRLKNELDRGKSTPELVNLTYLKMLPLLQKFYLASVDFRNTDYAVARTKQWLRQLSLRHNDLIAPFDRLKVLDAKSGFAEFLFASSKHTPNNLEH